MTCSKLIPAYGWGDDLAGHMTDKSGLGFEVWCDERTEDEEEREGDEGGEGLALAGDEQVIELEEHTEDMEDTEQERNELLMSNSGGLDSSPLSSSLLALV